MLILQFVFTDIKNKMVYVTSDHGRTFTNHPVHFSPSEIAFHEYLPLVFAVLDKEDPNKSVSITQTLNVYGNTLVTKLRWFLFILSKLVSCDALS